MATYFKTLIFGYLILAILAVKAKSAKMYVRRYNNRGSDMFEIFSLLSMKLYIVASH